MGASEWFTCVPWEIDPSDALRAAHQRALFEARRRTGAAGLSVESIREASGEDGTGTVIDIVDLSDEPEMCCASPAETSDLEEAFGTDRPTREDVDEGWEILAAVLDRWEAVYFPVFSSPDSTPTEWCFVGCTGDGGEAIGSLAPSSHRLQPLPELAAIIGREPCDRAGAVKRVWEYLRRQGLYDADPAMIRPDAALAELLGSKRVLRGGECIFRLTEAINAHLRPPSSEGGALDEGSPFDAAEADENEPDPDEPAPSTEPRPRPKLRLVK